MLPKGEKFTTSDFSKMKNLKSKKIHTPIGFFVVYEGHKKGIVISKKVFKRAVDRNKWKRLYYNALSEMKGLENSSFIFHPKKSFTKEELVNTLLQSVIQ